MAHTDFTVLVPVDFSAYSEHALKATSTILGRKPNRLVVLHVIDRDFIEKCIEHSLGTEGNMKKMLSVKAKTRLQDLLKKMEIQDAEPVVCVGTPFLEINKKAVECNADLIVIGSRGHSGDMEEIFFGSTTERVLRFIQRPVLCVPLDEFASP